VAPRFLETLLILGATYINFVFIKCCVLHVLDWCQYTQNECVPPCMHKGARVCARTGKLCWDDFVLAYDILYFCLLCAGFLLEVKQLEHEVDR
jgi:hypothetical protein